MKHSLLNVIGSLSKFIYLLPFLNYYIITKQREKFVFDSSFKYIKIGLILASISISLIFTVNVLGYFDILSAENTTFTQIYLFQITSNTVLSIAYFLLLISMLNVNESRRLQKNTFLTFFLLIGVISLFIQGSILLKLTIITYVTAIYLLSNGFLQTAKLLKKLKARFGFFATISSFILILDALVFTHMYTFCFTNLQQPACFYELRSLMYLISSIAMIFVNIPNLNFLVKLRTKKVIGYDKKDTLIENTIKRLYNQTQKIYGKVTLNILTNACASFKQENNKEVKCEGLNFKNLNYKEQKKYLKTLFRIYIKVLSKELFIELIKKIKDEENKSLIKECFPKDDIMLPQLIKPD